MRRAFRIAAALCAAFAPALSQGGPERRLESLRGAALALDPTRFALLPAPGARPADVRSALRRHGADLAGVAPFGVDGLLVAPTPLGRRTPAYFESWIDAIAQERAVAFVSPCWRDAYGGDVLVAPGLVVIFGRDVSPAVAGRILAEERAGTLRARDWCGVPGAWRLVPTSKSGARVFETAAALAARPEVRVAEPDLVSFGKPQHVPDDPDYARCWALQGAAERLDMGWEDAWDRTVGDPEIPVLVMDNGVEADHPDLVVAASADFTGSADGEGRGGPATAADAHGTSVAGVLSALMGNDVGGCGAAPGCALLSARAYRSLPRNGYVVASTAPARGLFWGRSRGARVSNFSAYLSVPSAFAAAAYDRARELGMIHFVAAGNFGAGSARFPATLASVHAVGALSPAGDLATFSCAGRGVAFVAPGIGVYTTDLRGLAGYERGDYAYKHGTSFAAPFAAAAAALVLSVDRTLDATATAEILRRCAVDLGAPGPDPTFGHGLVHAGRATAEAVLGEDVDPRTRRASTALSGLQADGPCEDGAASADGRWIAFASEATDLVPGDRNGVGDVFVKDVRSGAAIRVSVSYGAEANGASREPAMSADGRFVAFVTYASNLCVDDRNGVRDVYLRDRDADEDGVFDEPDDVETVLMSAGPADVAGDGPSAAPALSADGRVVAFETAARRLAPGGRGGRFDVVVRVRGADGFGRCVRVSEAPDGAAPDGDSRRAAVSADGSTVAFESRARGLDPSAPDDDDRCDVFVRRLDGGACRKASAGPAGSVADGESRRPLLSPDGATAWFLTTCSTLEASPRAPGPVRLASARDGVAVYVLDPDAADGGGPFAAASAPSAEADADVDPVRGARGLRLALHERLALTSDGRRLAFCASSALSGRGGRDAWTLDLVDGSLRAATPAHGGLGAGRASGVAFAGSDLLFDSDAEGLVRGDTNRVRDVFVRRAR
ncbi:MAG TPA: S8 family serine peptidase [Planctomycetota bacterium]|nr:S8 family serine peptidase [Planctomycetota bacterium]